MGVRRRAGILLGSVLIGLSGVVCLTERVVSSAAAELTAPGGGTLQVLITTSELAVGANRFAFGLLKDDKLLDAASVAVRIYDLRHQQAQLTAETGARHRKLRADEQGRHGHVQPEGAARWP